MFKDRVVRLGVQVLEVAVVVTIVIGLASVCTTAASTGFIENRGQVDQAVRYYAPGSRVATYFTQQAVVLDLREEIGESGLGAQYSPEPLTEDQGFEAPSRRGCTVWIHFEGANPAPITEGSGRLPTRYSYFLGADPSGWRTDVPAFAEVTYRDLWPGIDLIFREEGGTITCEAVVLPDADPGVIRFDYEGADQAVPSGDGAFRILTQFGSFTHTWPVPGRQDAAFAWDEDLFPTGDGTVPPDEPSMLVWAKYLGGGNTDYGWAVALDGSDNAYVTGWTLSDDFPSSAGAYDRQYSDGVILGWEDAFLARFDPDGNLDYCTYIGGTHRDMGIRVTVGSDNKPYVVGWTRGDGFPTTTGAFDETHNGLTDGFVLRLNPDGGDSQLEYSTFLGDGAWEEARAIAVRGTYVFVGGNTNSTDFPIANPYQAANNGGYDAFVTILEPDAAGDPVNQLIYSTYLGGSGSEAACRGIDVDPDGKVYVTAWTLHADPTPFPTTVGAYQATNQGGEDIFVAVLDRTLVGPAQLVYSTLLGGSDDDRGRDITLLPDPDYLYAYVAGVTFSGDFDISDEPFDYMRGGAADAFLTKLYPDAAGDPENQLVYSTYLGGSGGECCWGVTRDSRGHAYMTGETTSDNFPIRGPAYDDDRNGLQDAFVAKIIPDIDPADQLVYSTFLGGSLDEYGRIIALDGPGDIYTTGPTASDNFPADNAWGGGTEDGFVAKLKRPTCGVEPVVLDFGTVVIGSQVDLTFTIRNLGVDLLTGQVAETCDDYDIISGGDPYSLLPGEKHEVTVRFTPLSEGLKECTIETGDALCTDVSCTGVGQLPVATVVINEVYVSSPDYYDGSEYIELYNTTDAQLDLSGWVLSGTEYEGVCGEHHHEFPGGTVIPAYGYLIIARDVADGDGFEDRFQFLPDLEMYDPGDPFEVDDARVPNLTCQNPDAFDDQLRLIPGTADYGKLCGSVSAYEVMYLYAEPSRITLVDAMEYRDQDYCTEDACLGVNASDNDAFQGVPENNSGVSIGRDGNGTDTDNSNADFYYELPTPGEANIVTSCDVTPTELDFGTVSIGDHADLTFTIKNTGDGLLEGEVTESCDDYGIASGGGLYSLLPDETHVVEVRFEPLSQGLKECTIETGTLFCGDVTCTGVGVYPIVINEVYVSSPDPEDGSEYIELYNSGNVEFDLSGWVLSGTEWDRDCGEHHHQFPSGTIIPPGGYILIARDVADGDGFWDRFGFLPDLEMYDSDQTYEVDDPGVPNTICQNPDERDDQIRLIPGWDDYGMLCDSDYDAYEALYLFDDPTRANLIDAMEYRSQWFCFSDQCPGVNVSDDDAFVGVPYDDPSMSIGRDESGTDTDNSSQDFHFEIPTPAAQNIVNTAPRLSSLTYGPCAPTASDDVTVSCYVWDDDGILWVKCQYSVDEAPFQTITMSAQPENLYTGDIPAQSDGSQIRFYVEASDNPGIVGTLPADAPDDVSRYSVGLTLIQTVQTVAPGDDESYLLGQHVNCRGVVTAGRGGYNPFIFVIQDGPGPWAGIHVHQWHWTVPAQAGDDITVTGTVDEFFGLTRIELLPGCYTIHSSGNPEPPPVLVSTGDLAGTSILAESYEGVLVRVENAIVTNEDLGHGNWEINDGSGPCIVGQDDYYYSYEPEADDLLYEVQGVLTYRDGEYRVEPRGDADIVPPVSIPDVGHDPHAPEGSDEVTVATTVTSNSPPTLLMSSLIISVRLFYSTDGGASFDSTDMSSADSVYTAVIGPYPDGTAVDYFVEAWDNRGYSERKPSTGSWDFSVGSNTIYQVQYVPEGGDSSALAGEPVNLSGIVTVEPGIYGDHVFYIQNSHGGEETPEFRGVRVYDREGTVTAMRGDSVTVSGDVCEDSGETEIAMFFPEAITVHSSGNPVPDPYPLPTGSIDTSEAWEGVLVAAQSVIVLNPDAGSGQWLISNEGPAGACRVGDLANYTYEPYWGDSLDVQGTVAYADEEYMIQPRDDGDILELALATVADELSVPLELMMVVRPNPIVDGGRIEFSVPLSGEVTLKVYNVQGKLVDDLMDGWVGTGNHRVGWHGTNSSGNRLAPGIYFLRLETRRGSVTKKLVLCR